MKTDGNDFVECLAYSEQSAVVMTGNFSDSYEDGKVSGKVVANNVIIVPGRSNFA